MDQQHHDREERHQALDHHDRQQALSHQLDRIAPSRRAAWPKDDRRSSEQPSHPPPLPFLTDAERTDRWPIG